MKWIATLLLAASLTLGVVSATTAYLPRLSLPDDRLLGLTLNAPAGRTTTTEAAAAPIARDGETLSVELLTKLRAAGVERVRVKEFALGRWSHSGWFLLAMAGLGGGAWLMRVASHREVEAANGAASAGRHLTPAQAARRIHEIVAEVKAQLPGLPDDPARLRLIMDRFGEIQAELVPAVADGRQVLIAQAGLGAYAAFMDAFAAAERQINRAWSAAADGVYAEAVVCVDLAADLARRQAEQVPGEAGG